MIKSISIALLALALLSSSCGGALEAANTACRDECGQDFMSCIETGNCVDVRDGQIVPCDKECGEKRAACESGCG